MNRPASKEQIQKLGDKIDELSKRTGLTTDFIAKLLVDAVKEVSDYATANGISYEESRKHYEESEKFMVLMDILWGKAATA